MALTDDIAAALPTLRTEAEALMVDECTIRRLTDGDVVFNPGTGSYDEEPGDLVYSGRCKVQYRSMGTADAGEDRVTVLTVELHLPISATDVQVDDIATITSAVFDESLVDRKYRIVDDFAKTYATARRLRCEETVGE